LDLSDEQQGIIRQELSDLDPLGQIHNPTRSGYPYFSTDYVCLGRKEGKQEEIIWSSNRAVVQRKPDPDWFPVFRGKDLEENLLFLVFTFDERLGSTPIKNQLKKFWQRIFLKNTNNTGSVKNIWKFLNQLRESERDFSNHLKKVVASRLAVNPKDPYAADLKEYLRKESLVPWAKRRRQIRNQMLKKQSDLKKKVTGQNKSHRLSRKNSWPRDPFLKHIRLIPSVQTPLCQLWFPVGLAEKQLLKGFEKRFMNHKKNRRNMAGMPLRMSLTETSSPAILYSPPNPFKRTTRQSADKGEKLDFPWLGLTGHLIKKREGQISKNSPTVIKLLKKNMAADLEAINSARLNVERLMLEIHTHWQQQLLLP